MCPACARLPRTRPAGPAAAASRRTRSVVSYALKEMFYTLQGEGAQSGRPAVFVRFAGCNLWSGHARDRDQGPGGCSRWCDTDFVGTDGSGGGRFPTATELVSAAL